MKSAAITQSELETLYQEHIRKESAIWENLKEELVSKYLEQGYYIWWAREKADKDILELRSKPRNIHHMPPVGEFHQLEFEPLD